MPKKPVNPLVRRIINSAKPGGNTKVTPTPTTKTTKQTQKPGKEATAEATN